MDSEIRDIEIRALAPDDALRHRELMAQSFGRGQVQNPLGPDETPDLAGVFGLFARGALRAAYTLLPFDVHWGGGKILPMGGIAGVGSFVETRGRGDVAALLRHSLETMRAAGQTISALYPFSWAFYRRSGWEWVGEGRHVSLPLSVIPSSPERRNIHPLRAEEAQKTLEPIYTAYAARYRGMFAASSHQWDRLLEPSDNRTAYVFIHQEAAGAPDGYLVWRYPKEGDTGQVREFVANSPAAYRGLLSLLHHFGTQTNKMKVALPADDPFWSHVMHWDMETRTGPVFQARVVDVPAALAALTPEGEEGEATIALQDENAPWNTGTWRIRVESGTVSCDAVTGEADLACDIQAFSQAFWGTPSLLWLRRAGRIDAVNERAVTWLDRVLSGPPVWTTDGF